MGKSFLLVDNNKQERSILFIDGQVAQLVYIPVYTHGDKEAIVAYTFGEPGVDESHDGVVVIAYYN